MNVLKHHTPGPWHAINYSAYAEHPIEIAAGPTLIADVTTTSIRKQGRANAKLIAAAPEMLSALQEIYATTPAHPSGIIAYSILEKLHKA